MSAQKAWLLEGVVPSDYPLMVAADHSDLLEIVERRVKPLRMKLGNKPIDRQRKKYWWRFAASAKGLYETTRDFSNVIALGRISPHLAPTILQTGMVYSENTVVFAWYGKAPFCCISCRTHETWVRSMMSSFEDRIIYSPSDVFSTFPFPRDFESARELEIVGEAYHDHRAALMIARDEGITKTYNRFHDRNEHADDIERLRDLHAAMDRAVLAAYGWHDLAARAEPEWLDEDNEPEHAYQGRLFWPSAFRDEVLGRLLALNAERAAAERAAGLVAAPVEEVNDEAA